MRFPFRRDANFSPALMLEALGGFHRARANLLIYARSAQNQKAAHVCTHTLCAGTNKKIPVKLSCGTLLRTAARTWGMLRGFEKPLCKVLRKGANERANEEPVF